MFFRAGVPRELGYRGVWTGKRGACVTVQTYGGVLPLLICLTGQISYLSCAGHSMFMAMVPEITFVTGQRWRWEMRPYVVYFRWWESFSLCCYAPFIGDLVHACFDNLCDREHELQRCQSVASGCVHKRSLFDPAVDAAIKNFVQRSHPGHIRKHRFYKLGKDVFRPTSTLAVPVMKKSEIVFDNFFCRSESASRILAAYFLRNGTSIMFANVRIGFKLSAKRSRCQLAAW